MSICQNLTPHSLALSNYDHQTNTLTCTSAVKSELVKIARLTPPGVDKEDTGIFCTVTLPIVSITVSAVAHCTGRLAVTGNTPNQVYISEEVAALRISIRSS